MNGQGCRKCGILKRANKIRSNNKEFIEKANKVHGSIYDYSKVDYKNNTTKVIITCREHGDFNQEPGSHLKGAGCNKCRGGIKLTIEEFIEKANKVHSGVYDYSHVEYKNAFECVKIICKLHGAYNQKPYVHLNGCSCPKCGIEKNANNNRTTKEEFIEKANKIHNFKYDYSNVVYVNNTTKVIINCSEHGDFKQSPVCHLKNQGCKICNPRRYSKKQILWLNFISKLNNIYIQHAENEGEFLVPGTKFLADGYCKETNTIYEFHGDYWHGNPKIYCCDETNKTSKLTFGELYKRTLDREDRFKNMGYNVVSIWESEWIKLNKCIRVLQRKYKSIRV